MKVFISVKSLLPSYGGPAFSVSRLAEALAGQGIHVGLWSADQSANTTELLKPTSRVQRLAGAERPALAAFGRPNVLHDNGMWLPHNHAFASLATEEGLPRIVSTRGMLEPWAVGHKRWKKALAWWAYQRHDLARAQLHHATAPAEERNVRALDLGVPVCTIPNGVDIPANGAASHGGGATRTALFVGRIYPVKGLPMLIEAWARAGLAGWRLQIAGPDEGGHRAEVERAVAKAGLNGTVSFLGPLGAAAKQAALQQANLLVLPSYSESFGMVVGEALAQGVPVLTTMAVPWPQLGRDGCGWRVPATVDGLATGLRTAADCDGATLQAMGARGRELIAAEYGWPAVARRFVEAYERLSRPV